MTVYLFDNSKKLIGDIPDVYMHTQKTILGGMITAALSVGYEDLLDQAHYFGSQDVDDDSIFHMYRISSYKKEGKTASINGVHILFDELQSGVVRDIRPQDVSAGIALGRILEGSQWTIGTNQATRVASSTYYYQSRLSAFWNYIATWQVEFRPRLVFVGGQIVGRFIDIYDQMSGDAGKWFEYGDKLITVTAEQANEGIYTALIGMGKGEEVGGGFGRKIRFDTVEWSLANGDPVDKPLGQDYVSLPSAVAIYGFREAVVDFPDIEDRAVLLQKTYEDLLVRSRPKVEFYAEALETGNIEIGETVTIVRDDLGIRYKTRVFELERNFLNPTIKSFRFGDKISVSSADRLKYTAQEIKQQETAYRSLYELNRQAIVESYINGDAFEYRLLIGNEYGLPAGTYSFDKPIDQNPTSVIYTGAGKFLIANSKLPSGDWDWRTFGSGAGLGADIVAANNIIAGSISSNHIDTDGIDARLIRLTNNTTVEDAINSLETSQITGQYYVSTSPSSLISGSWSDTAPTPAQMAGKFVWTRMKYTYGNGTTDYSDPICVTGAKGQDGSDGNDGQDGAPGVSTAIVYLYIRDFAPSSPPNSNTTYTFSTGILTGFTAWSQDIPDTTRDPVWVTKAIATAPATSPTATIPPSAWSEPALFVEDGRGIESVQVQFAQHTDGENHPAENSPSWSATPPEWIEGQFIWKRTRVEYKDSSIEFVGYECIDAEIANRLKEELNQHEASIQQVHAQMQVLDGALQTTVTEVGSLKDTQVMMMQTQDQWQVVVEAIQAETGQSTVTVDQVKKYMKFDEDFLTIGKSGSPLEIQITNEAVNFVDGGERVAWISGQQLHIGSAVVVERLTVGNHVFVKHDPSDITVFRWING